MMFAPKNTFSPEFGGGKSPTLAPVSYAYGSFPGIHGSCACVHRRPLLTDDPGFSCGGSSVCCTNASNVVAINSVSAVGSDRIHGVSSLVMYRFRAGIDFLRGGGGRIQPSAHHCDVSVERRGGDFRRSRREWISYSNTTVYYEIHQSSECISVYCGVTNLIHDRRIVVLISRLKSGECGSMCPLKREQARREMQQWVMRRFPTADCIVEIGRKSRS